MRVVPLALACALTLGLAGCNSIAGKTNTLSDEQIKSQTSGAWVMRPRTSASSAVAPKAPTPMWP